MRRAPVVALLVTLIVPRVMADPPLAGTYSLDRGQSDNVEKAIEVTIRKMNFVTRAVARGRLRKTNPAYQSITLGFTGQDARITAGPDDPVILPASGEPVRWKRGDGEVFTVSGKLRNGSYTETFEAKDGRRSNVFSLTSDGALMLHVTVTSTRLPAELRYTLIYRRS